jgi:hypothetical protein
VKIAFCGSSTGSSSSSLAAMNARRLSGTSSRLRNGESVPAATKQAGRSGVDGAMMFVLNRIGVDVEVDVDGDAAVGVEERAGLGRFNFFMRASKIRSKTSRWQA